MGRSSGSSLVVLAVAGLVGLAGCSGSSTSGGKSESALRVKVGQCVVPPKVPTTELSSVSVVGCTTLHTQEAYALVDFVAAASAANPDSYPGPDVLKKFADGACAQRYQGYVGVSYADSSLFFTYLLPSARGWQAGDHSITCFVTTTGASLTKSVKGSKL
jgi:hypothetical protein